MYVPDNSDRYAEYEKEMERLERLHKKQEYEEELELSELPFYKED